MSTIAISDLRPIGSELLIDSESYLRELTDNELALSKGGVSPSLLTVGLVVSGAATAAASAVVSAYTAYRYLRG